MPCHVTRAGVNKMLKFYIQTWICCTGIVRSWLENVRKLACDGLQELEINVTIEQPELKRGMNQY